ncbi:MAG: hypothetical protein ACJA0H_002510 [Francisellaceae bacterium]|jgi:hypothetical protein
MKGLTVEARIRKLYNCSVVEFFQKCVDEGLETYEIAEMINCSVSNLRRIARKYNYTFFQPEPVQMFSDSENFSTKKLNLDNLLSRSWGIKTTA